MIDPNSAQSEEEKNFSGQKDKSVKGILRMQTVVLTGEQKFDLEAKQQRKYTTRLRKMQSRENLTIITKGLAT